jgi:hypothetical protein
MENAVREIQYFLKGTQLLVHRCEKVHCNKGRIYSKIAKFFHLKKLVRLETFGPYHILYNHNLIISSALFIS